MQVEETEFYRTRNGNVLGPFTHKPHIGWIVPGLRVSWDNDGRLRRSTIEEHPLDLIAPATIVEASLAPLEERSCEMSDEEGHLFEAVDQLTSKGHGYIDLDNADLPAGLALLQAAGHAIDAEAIIDAPVGAGELP